MKTTIYFKKKYVLVFLILGLLNGTAFSQDDSKTRTTQYNIDKYSVAVSGYDVVSYFEGKAEKGKADNYFFYKGIRYEFTTAAHLAQFKQNPEKYEPAYGGWCAYAMGATGEKVEVDPTKYKVVNGKLYLFYYSFINNTLNKWNLDEAHLKAEADKNWRKTLDKK
jgi:YHS domain-containing protein